MTNERDVSHGDLLLAIGNMQGKLDALVTTMAQQRADVGEAFRRLSEAEKRIAQGVILAVVVSFTVPLFVVAVAPKISFGLHPTVEDRR
jgi:hypothetical protein